MKLVTLALNLVSYASGSWSLPRFLHSSKPSSLCQMFTTSFKWKQVLSITLTRGNPPHFSEGEMAEPVRLK